MTYYSKESRTRKYIEEYEFLSFMRKRINTGKSIRYYYKNRTRCSETVE